MIRNLASFSSALLIGYVSIEICMQKNLPFYTYVCQFMSDNAWQPLHCLVTSCYQKRYLLLVYVENYLMVIHRVMFNIPGCDEENLFGQQTQS